MYQVPHRYRHAPRIRYATGQLRNALLRKVTSRAAAQDEGARGDPAEVREPARIGLVDPAPDGERHVPVEGELPLRSDGDAPFTGQGSGDVLQDQPPHPRRALRREEAGHEPAHRVGDHVHALQPESVQEAEDVVPHQRQRVGTGPVAAAVAAQIERVHAPVAREGGRHAAPVRRPLPQGVQEDERRSARRAGDAVGQADAPGLDGSLLDGRVIVHAPKLPTAPDRRSPVRPRPNGQAAAQSG
ncbi:hypothetical protein GCM10010359_57140 [Streptomyces morookaense]|nr:hypothetical protein GCM10010359_57140 [Streptomyces morookaense]